MKKIVFATAFTLTLTGFAFAATEYQHEQYGDNNTATVTQSENNWHAVLYQNGDDNTATIHQGMLGYYTDTGGKKWGYAEIHQDGSNNTATITDLLEDGTQVDSNMTYGYIEQVGDDNIASIKQGEGSILKGPVWQNRADVYQDGGDQADITQSGSFHTVILDQNDGAQTVTISQDGQYAYANVIQQNGQNTATINQKTEGQTQDGLKFVRSTVNLSQDGGHTATLTQGNSWDITSPYTATVDADANGITLNQESDGTVHHTAVISQYGAKNLALVNQISSNTSFTADITQVGIGNTLHYNQ